MDYFWALLCTYYLKHTTNHDALKKSVFLTVMTSSTARRANFYTHIHYHDTSWCFDNDFSSLKRILHLLYTQNKPFFKFLQFFYYDVINGALWRHNVENVFGSFGFLTQNFILYNISKNQPTNMKTPLRVPFRPNYIGCLHAGSKERCRLVLPTISVDCQMRMRTTSLIKTICRAHAYCDLSCVLPT